MAVSSSRMGSMVFSSLKYLSTVMPLWVMAYTMRFLPTVFSWTRFCWIRKSRYCFRTLQFTFALYMMWVSLRGPLWARTLRMSIYISSLDLRMGMPRLGSIFVAWIYIIYGFGIRFFCLWFGVRGLFRGLFLFVFFGRRLCGFGRLLPGRLLGCIGFLVVGFGFLL